MTRRPSVLLTSSRLVAVGVLVGHRHTSHDSTMNAHRTGLKLTCANLFVPASEQQCECHATACESVAHHVHVWLERCVLRRAARNCTMALHSRDVAIERSSCGSSIGEEKLGSA